MGECALAARSLRFLGLREALVKMMLDEGDGQSLGVFMELRPVVHSRWRDTGSEVSGSDSIEVS